MLNWDVVNLNFTTSQFDTFTHLLNYAIIWLWKNLRQLFKDNLNTDFITAVLSNPRQKRARQ